MLVLLIVVLGVAGVVLLVHRQGATATTSVREATTQPLRGGGQARPEGSTTSRPPATTVPPSAPPRSPATTAAAPAMSSPLGPAVTSYVGTRSGTLTAAVEDLDTGATWTLNPGTTEATASIVKVDIMEALLAQQTKGTALSTSEQAALAPMIEESDNDSATALWTAAGSAPGIADFNATIGLTDTTPSSCLTCPGFEWPGWGLTTTTATDQLTLLDHVVEPNAVLGPGERSEALSLMENVDADERWGVSTGVPPGVTVALKNGWVPLQDGLWQIDTIGWIDGDGRDYLIAVLDDGNANESYGIDTVDQVGQLVWTALAPP